jgi:hypothetical protein
MVFTHIPRTSACGDPVRAIRSVVIGRCCWRSGLLSQMDVPTRSSYVMAIVLPEERPAAREHHHGAAQPRLGAGPAIAGVLLAASPFRLAAGGGGRREDRIRPHAARDLSQGASSRRAARRMIPTYKRSDM